VDILRITRVLRAQTDNPRLLDAYNKLDHDLRMGQGLADAMEQAPEVFSPFAVSLVRQGEARNDIAGAFYKFADFLQKEDEVAVTHRQDFPAGRGSESTPAGGRYSVVTPSTILPVWVIDDLISRAQVAALRIFTVVSGLLLTLAAVWASVEVGLVERRWQNVVVCSVAALFIGGAGMWLRRRIEEDSTREQERRRILEGQAAKDLGEASDSELENEMRIRVGNGATSDNAASDNGASGNAASGNAADVFPRGSQAGTTAWRAGGAGPSGAACAAGALIAGAGSPASDRSASGNENIAASRSTNEATFE
jgi:hypothetical protein